MQDRKPLIRRTRSLCQPHILSVYSRTTKTCRRVYMGKYPGIPILLCTPQCHNEKILAHLSCFWRRRRSPFPNRVTTTASVKEGGKDTKTPETLGMICNVAIVRHEGILQTRCVSCLCVLCDFAAVGPAIPLLVAADFKPMEFVPRRPPCVRTSLPELSTDF